MLEYLCRYEIHESQILLGFRGIILKFLRLEVLPLFLPFYTMLFMNKFEFSSMIEFLYRFLKSRGWYGVFGRRLLYLEVQRAEDVEN